MAQRTLGGYRHKYRRLHGSMDSRDRQSSGIGPGIPTINLAVKALLHEVTVAESREKGYF